MKPLRGDTGLWGIHTDDSDQLEQQWLLEPRFSEAIAKAVYAVIVMAISAAHQRGYKLYVVEEDINGLYFVACYRWNSLAEQMEDAMKDVILVNLTQQEADGWSDRFNELHYLVVQSRQQQAPMNNSVQRFLRYLQ